MYIYPENLTAKATLWLWTLRDVAVIGLGLFLSAFAAVELGLLLPLVLVAAYTFLTIQSDGMSILGFLNRAASFLFLVPQRYEWGMRA